VPVEKVFRMSGRKQTNRRDRSQDNRKTAVNRKSNNRKKVKHAKRR